MSLVATRERRPNAGNRMRELLERELEIEEMFEEVANDEDFMMIQEEDDTIDSDFDQSTAGEDEDEESAEKQILADEKMEKKKRAKKSNLTPFAPFLRAGDKKKSVVTSKVVPGREIKSESTKVISEKKKKQAFQVPLLSGTRSSSRTHTVQSKQMLAEKLKEYEARKALTPRKEKIPEKPKTQEELLAQAKITEEKNLASLRAYEVKEAEKKKTVGKLNKIRITGPFIRQISYVCSDDKRNKKRPRLVTEVSTDEDGNKVTREIHSEIDENNTNNMSVTNDQEEKEQESREARNLIIFKDFDKKLEAELFQEWKINPKEIEKAICPITGEPAKYRDPKSGVPYANMDAYKRLQQVLGHEYLWSSEKGTLL